VRRVGLAVALGLSAGCVRPPVSPVVTADYPTLVADDDPIDPYAVPEGTRAEGSDAERRVGDDILVDVEFGDPRAVQELVVDMQVGDYELPSAPSFRVEHRAGGVQRITLRPGPGIEVTRAARREALAATETLDSDDPTIRAVARGAIAGDRTNRQRVDSLIGWVYMHISYVLGDETVASAVLHAGTGDCSEMSLLFVAMARSVGIPARRAVGLAGTYVDGHAAFGYHAWAEVELDGHWVQVDPTWNERVADATHITLLQGDGDEWGAAAAVLAVAVVDITRDPAADDSDPRRLARELPVFLRLRK